jgi:hypothetical protein
MPKYTNTRIGVLVLSLLLIGAVIAIAQSEAIIYSPIVFGPSQFFLGPNEEEPNNNFAEANGPIAPNFDYRGLPNDPDDYYFIESGETSDIKIFLTGLDVSEGQLLVYQQLTDSAPVLIETSTHPPPDINLTISRTAPGKYFIVVHAGPAALLLRQDNFYTLRVEYPPALPPTPEPTPTQTPTVGPSPTSTPTIEPTPRDTPPATNTPEPTATKGITE